MRKFVVSILAMIFVFGSLFVLNKNVNATNYSSPLDSSESYLNYLSSYSLTQALKSGVTTRALSVEASTNGSEEIIKDFTNLSKQQQETLLSVLRDPKLQKAIYEGDFEKLPSVIREQFYWSEEVTETPNKNSKAASKTVTHTGKLSALGISLTSYKITGQYEYNSSGATKALSTKPVVVSNYNPAVDTGLQWYNHYIKSKEYVGESTFYYRIGVQGVGGFQIGNINLDVAGKQNGKTWGSFYRN
ncbi:hypothetical protein [Niallia taxi]|uniref:hypothetical protein n=1 Tax=Niallia taxi TaxID=2499688 RepID=UPI003D28978F